MPIGNLFKRKTQKMIFSALGVVAVILIIVLAVLRITKPLWIDGYNTKSKMRGTGCVLPELPKSGFYEVDGKAPTPGNRVRNNTLLHYTCDKNHYPFPDTTIFCQGDVWSDIIQCLS